ncbi:hypothetical protein Dimus_010850 [Dionaea muscipula]
MSSPPREWSWEPRITIHPSLMEMTPLRIPSPAPDSPEYSRQGSEESSFSSDEGCPPCKLGKGDTLHVLGKGFIPYALEEGVTSHGLGGAPPQFPLAARSEGRSPRKLRIKLKSRSLDESSQSHHETTTLCVVDVVNTLGPLPGREGIMSLEPPNDESPLTSSMRPAGCQALLRFFFQKNLKSYAPEPFECPNVMRSGGRIGFAKVLKKTLSEAESLLVQVFDQRLNEGRLWDIPQEAELRTPPLQDLTWIPSLDETGMTKGRRIQLPSGTFARGGRGRRRAGGRGRPDSPDRVRVSTRDLDDRDRRSSRDAEDRPPKPPSAELTRGKEVASDYPWESQKRRQPTGLIDFHDLIGGRFLWEA